MFLLLFTTAGLCAQAPVNDDCSNAEAIAIPNSGYNTGTFTSAQVSLANATVQVGETFAPALSLASIDKKSVWFKFSLPTTRAVRITMTQPGIAIPAGDAGFTIYQSQACLPANTDISTKLTPIVTFGNTYHPCVPAGDYLVQVAGKASANGPINIVVEISDPGGAQYDRPSQAFAFGVAGTYARKVDFDAGCHSSDETTEVCNVLSSTAAYRKTAWFTFSTPAYLDYLIVTLSGTNGYFTGGGPTVYKKFGYTLYQGDATTTPISSLTAVNSCDSLLTNGYHCGIKQYMCNDLQPGTKYSIQLFMPEGFTERLRLGILTGGIAPTVAPLPVTGIGPSHALGNLNTSPAGVASFLIGYFGCNSKHSVSNCSPLVPAAGVTYGSYNYDLSSFGTFTLQSPADINIKVDPVLCGVKPIVRLFKQSVTANCGDVSLSNLVGTIPNSSTFNCLPPGDYLVQVMGVDSALSRDTITYKTLLNNFNMCLFTDLGGRYAITITGYSRKSINQFSINTTGMFDSINVVNGVQQPLSENVDYIAMADTFGCGTTVRPADTSCYANSDRVMYRQFVVADSGTITFKTLFDPASSPNPILYKLYKGDANALATAQNMFSYPGTFSGLVANTECFNGRLRCDNKSTCVIPGTYTFTSMGAQANIGNTDQPTFTFKRTRTIHNSPITAQDMGNIIDTIGPAGGTMLSDIDTWSCDDNAVPINDYNPCAFLGRPATKAIYRQFYLKDPSLVRIKSENTGSCSAPAGIMTLFSGKATDGLRYLSTIESKWNCFNNANNINDCKPLPAGWYTVVSWGTGPSYDSTMRLLYAETRYNSHITYTDQFEITVEPDCKGPQFNRPYKASVQPNGQPHLLEWGPTTNSTGAYPETYRLDTLPTEYFNCIADTPFSSHPISPCVQGMNRVAYYVFTITKVSYLQINTRGLIGKVYDKDVRIDSLLFGNAAPIHECMMDIGYLQFCNLQPGTYTLVLFAGDQARCSDFTPQYYIDSIAYSRFDFAQNAYDFGIVPPDSLYHFGKPGDINPIDANRPPSSDFIFCTTGSSITDPPNSSCNTVFNGNIYNPAPNQPLYNAAYPVTAGSIARRNLWYTFVAAYPGRINIKVNSKTGIHTFQPQFAIFSSNVDGSLPFTTVQANGFVDSTVTQGLQFIVKNYVIDRIPPPCFAAPDTISFYRTACDTRPTRYYIMVDNVNANSEEAGGQLPNSQIDVSILIDSIDQLFTKYDHYSLAGNIVTNGPGSYRGETDNYSCATRDATDPLYSGPNTCNRTLWYKFTPTISGNVRYRVRIGNLFYYDSSNVKLFRQRTPGDSTFSGLSLQAAEKDTLPSGAWSSSCVSPGTYYLLLPGCGRNFENVYPEIELIENEGDICSNAVPVTISNAGTASNRVRVTCHTIGTDYGEFGPTLTCPQGAATALYKTSWFRLDINGSDTLDVTASLSENTNAVGADIKYRMMTGDCGAMQEQSCVQDALTQNTYQCLVPGLSYYLQVMTPVTKNGIPVSGTIDLMVTAVAHADTCSPLTNCLALANFTSSFNCQTSDSVLFVNTSTYGSNIDYEWHWGYNNESSTAISPSFLYPALAYDSTYTVTLVVKNTGCGKSDTLIKTVTVPARPLADLGNDIIHCDNSVPVILSAASYPGAIYQWQDNSNADTLLVTATGKRDYHVTVTYNGCSSSDTVSVFISPITARPIQKVFVCPGANTIHAARGVGETYTWNTGDTTASIQVTNAGIYWVDIAYNNCTYRDSFDVSTAGNINSILGNDTILCFSRNSYTLNAFVTNAGGYTWQNGSNADTFLVTMPGQYYVAINIAACIVRDTVNIAGYPAAVKKTIDTSACIGSNLLLPWGQTVNQPGIYTDTVFSSKGCDSMISIYNVTLTAKPNLGSDTMVNICSGNTIDLNSIYNTGNNINQWSRNTIMLSDVSSISNEGNYQLVTTNPNGCSDTVIVTLVVNNKPVVVINNPAVSCANTPVDLTVAAITNGSSTGLTFTYWQNANATISYNNATSAAGGTYYIKGADANGCFDIKPVVVTNYPLPGVTTGNDFAICNNDSAVLNAVVSNATIPLSYLWQPAVEGGIRDPGSLSTVVKPAATQQYILTVTDSCNLSVADTIIVVVQPPVKAFAGNDTIAVTGLPHQLTGTGGVDYTWEPASLLNDPHIANPLATIYADSILFRVTVKDSEGCTGHATIKVRTYNGITYYVPNAFSPNGDGRNDVFRAIPVGIVATEYFRVFNRFGQLIFETSQLMKGWDGNYNGKPQLPGNYVWVLKGKGRNGRPIEMKGNVVLIR